MFENNINNKNEHIEIFSLDEIKETIKNKAIIFPFEMNLRINFDTDLLDLSKKAALYILRFYISFGVLIEIHYSFDLFSNEIHLWSSDIY